MGSNLVRYLYKNYPDYSIWNLDLITYAGNPENLADIETKERNKTSVNQRYHFIRGDICDELLLEYLFEKNSFDAVIHLAAETHVDRSITDARNFVRTNVKGVQALFDVMRLHPVPRIIHISTDEVYGDRLGLDPADELAAFRPSNPYSASKAAGDLLVQSYIRTYHMPAIIVRAANNYGPRQHPEKLIPIAISNLLEGKKMPIHGKGDSIRSWLFVSDFASAIDTLLHKGVLGEWYNVGGIEKTIGEVAERIATLLGRDPKKSIEYVSARPGADMRYALSWEKIRTNHQWQPKYTFEKALADTVDWYVANKEWWKRVRATQSFQASYERQATGKWFGNTNSF